MNRKWKLSDFRERIEIYSLTTQANDQGFPVDTLTRHSCPFAKVERGSQVNEDTDGKRNIEEVWNILLKSEVCKLVKPEYKIKINSVNTFLDILNIEEVDIYVNRIIAKAEK